jgi:hypothetical protein
MTDSFVYTNLSVNDRPATLPRSSACCLPVSVATPPADAEICPACFAYVTDIGGHMVALH